MFNNLSCCTRLEVLCYDDDDGEGQTHNHLRDDARGARVRRVVLQSAPFFDDDALDN